MKSKVVVILVLFSFFMVMVSCQQKKESKTEEGKAVEQVQEAAPTPAPPETTQEQPAMQGEESGQTQGIEENAVTEEAPAATEAQPAETEESPTTTGSGESSTQ
jgi:hypothetical protein